PPVEPGVVTVGSIHGGTKHNIIPDQVKLQLTVRAYSAETRDALIDGIRRIARGQALAAGLPEDKLPEVTVQDEHTRSTYNNPELVQRVVGVIEATLGEDQVESVPAVMGGEDFSEYGLTDPAIPSFIYWLGGVEPRTYQAAKSSGESLPSLHSPFFAPDAPLAIETGVRAMTAAALDLLAAAPEAVADGE
ncbi:M20/M25/M40 family metallo-hydrolase, partial [uncultured Abyssibacter sp.]|uniref:M20/M25/M40 family metallo-hydrolase n=1 Tax=uncultured Abyssibacter sp. TaxID=2320202 RepID=UPI0032B2B050